ncbi:forkhead domain-containing protein [Phanerochaete sordida]|uniref:Forkhead domain-containing protein n=1 Tax=Phanerochaete sordida TaxID=48140 RepID=A0A9P3LBM5_9APHY|nr:forkhead domain-containing protein [Phanerochaete sordida]
MPADSPRTPSQASTATNTPSSPRASPRPSHQADPRDIHAGIQRGPRPWELGTPLDFVPPPAISSEPPLPPALGFHPLRWGSFDSQPLPADDFWLPADAPTPRPPPRDHPFDPLDDALESQGFAPRASRPVARNATRDDFAEGSSGEAGGFGDVDERELGEDEAIHHSTSNSLASDGRGGRDQRQGSTSEMSVDEPRAALTTSGQQIELVEEATRLANAEIRRMRYPAYDVNGRRIGLEHTQLQPPPPPGNAGGSYYRARTHNYPGPNVNTSDLPHVMSLDMRISPAAIAPSGSAQSMFFRTHSRPDTLHPSSYLQGQFRTPLPPRNTSPPPPPPVPPIRDPTGILRLTAPRVASTSQTQSRPSAYPGTPQPTPSPLSPPTSTASVSDTQSVGRASEPPPSPSPAPEPIPAEALAGPSQNPRVPDFEVETPEIPDAGPALRELLGLDDDEEISLNALEEPPDGEKPTQSLPTLIKLAIYGSPHKRLTLQEIYTAIESRFQWYRENKDKAWKDSIRHNLSLNKCFRRVPRPISEPGKGYFWVVDYSQGEGNKRQRKRNKKKTKAELRALAERATRQGRSVSESSDDSGNTAEATPGPRRPTATRSSQASRSPTLDAMLPPPPPGSATRSPSAPRGGLPPELWPQKGNKRSLMHLLSTPRLDTTSMPPGTPGPSSARDSPSMIAARLDDAHIDPLLRDPAPEGGHVVGEGRLRHAARGRGPSPYSVLYAPPHPGHPAASPSTNWAPYGSPSPLQTTQPLPGRSVLAGNMLGLSGRGPTPGPSSSGTFSIPGPSDTPPARPPRASTSARARREEPQADGEGPRRSARVRAKRTDYRDSRGAVYADAGREPVSSSSEED